MRDSNLYCSTGGSAERENLVRLTNREAEVREEPIQKRGWVECEQTITCDVGEEEGSFLMS